MRHLVVRKTALSDDKVMRTSRRVRVMGGRLMRGMMAAAAAAARVVVVVVVV